MPIRKPIYKGGYYHIYSRGAKKMFLFNDEWDCNYFLSLASSLLKEYENKLVAYCLMSNHYHFLLKVKNKTVLAKMMHRIGLTYAIYYNKKYCTSGHVFQGRYQSINVKSRSYLVYLSRYIHRNPIEAGIVDVGLLETFKWSSFPKYMGIVKKSKVKLHLEPVLENFIDIENYREYCLLDDVSAKTMFTDLYWTPGLM